MEEKTYIEIFAEFANCMNKCHTILQGLLSCTENCLEHVKEIWMLQRYIEPCRDDFKKSENMVTDLIAAIMRNPLPNEVNTAIKSLFTYIDICGIEFEEFLSTCSREDADELRKAASYCDFGGHTESLLSLKGMLDITIYKFKMDMLLLCRKYHYPEDIKLIGYKANNEASTIPEQTNQEAKQKQAKKPKTDADYINGFMLCVAGVNDEEKQQNFARIKEIMKGRSKANDAVEGLERALVSILLEYIPNYKEFNAVFPGICERGAYDRNLRKYRLVSKKRERQNK